jgi:hypothetical protein
MPCTMPIKVNSATSTRTRPISCAWRGNADALDGQPGSR